VFAEYVLFVHAASNKVVKYICNK